MATSNRFTVIKPFIFLMMFLGADGKKSKKKSIDRNEEGEDYDADVFCKSQSRLIKLEKSDEFIVVDTLLGNSVLLQCKYCEERDNGYPRTWSKQKHIFTGNITEVESSMENDANLSSVFVAKDHSLVLRNLKESDSGLYFCKAPYVNSPEKSFNYLVDFSNKCSSEIRGTVTDFKNYTQFYIAKVNQVISNKTFLEGTNTSLRVFTDWSAWSDCDSCLRSEGIRFRLGKCRIKVFFHSFSDSENCLRNFTNFKTLVFDEKQNTEKPLKDDSDVADVLLVKENIVNFDIPLSCRSSLLRKLNSDLYNITSSIPDFLLSDKCNEPCKGRSLRKGPRYRKSIILATGAHLTLVCPDSTIDSQVRWEHNRLRLLPNEGTDLIPGTSEPRLYVDSFNTLYLFEVTEKESGNFTCFVDGLRMQEVKIIVLTRSLFFTKEFTRHLKYLGFVFLICFFAYIAGIVVMCVKTQAEKKRIKKVCADSKKLLEEKQNCDSDYSS